MSTAAEPNTPGKTADENSDLAGTPDVPSVNEPEKFETILATNPTLEDLKKAQQKLEEELKNAEGAANDAQEKGEEVPPEVDKKTMETTATEADRLRAMMAAQSMHGHNSKLGFPLVDEAVKAVMRLLKALANLIRRRTNEPDFGAGDPSMAAAANSTLKKVDGAENAVNDAMKEVKANKQRELDNANDLDSPSPNTPGGTAPRPK